MDSDGSNAESASEYTNPQAQKPVCFSQIAGGKTELIIEHEGQLYRLRVTKNGKLLLNK